MSYFISERSDDGVISRGLKQNKNVSDINFVHFWLRKISV
jgi:hypothetical protein